MTTDHRPTAPGQLLKAAYIVMVIIGLVVWGLVYACGQPSEDAFGDEPPTHPIAR